MHDIDLDTEAIWYDNAWFTREDLVRKVKSMIDAGDYMVARPSQALEQLTQTLASSRALAVKVTPEMADAINAAAERDGRAAGSLIREALSIYLAQRYAVGAPAPETTDSAAASVVPPAATTAIDTEPVSPEEAAGAVTLTSKKREGDEKPSMEKRWFGR